MTKPPGDEYSSAWKKFSERRAQFSLGDMQSIKSQLDECTRVLERHRESLLTYPNVVGIGVSMKYKNGEVLDRPCIIIEVTKKIPDLKEGAVPKEIDGCPTDVLETGEHIAQQSLPGPVCPLQPGYSIGHKKITYGTLGGLVREKSGLRVRNSPFSDILLLSNNHVLANENKAKKGDSIQHPGPSLDQQPLKPSLKSAILVRWKPLVKPPAVNEIDAAVARPVVPFSPDIKMIGISGGLRNVNTLNFGDQVQLTGAPVNPEAMWTMMKQLRNRIIRMLENGAITDDEERQRLYYLLKAKKWNPYCIRHSAITSDSDFLPEYALKKKVRWSMNSKQGSRYIKGRMGNDLKNQILVHNGIITEEAALMQRKPSISACPRCNLVNAIENKYCSKCSYPLVPSAFDEIKEAENAKVEAMAEKYEQEMKNIRKEMRDEIKKQITQLMTILKPEIVKEGLS